MKYLTQAKKIEHILSLGHIRNIAVQETNTFKFRYIFIFNDILNDDNPFLSFEQEVNSITDFVNNVYKAII